MKHSLLALLAESPGTGYALKQRYEDRTGALWPVNIGQVYKTLARLEQDGLVAHPRGGESAPFELTALGRAELSVWLVKPVPMAGLRDELVVKVLLALGTPGVDGREVVQHHRRAVVEETQRITHTCQGEDLTWTLVESLGARRAGTIWSAVTPSQAAALAGPDSPDRPATVQIATPEALAVLNVTDGPTLDAFAHGSALRIERQAVRSPAAITAADGTEQRVPVVDVHTGTVGVLGTLAVPPDVADRLGLTEVTQLSVILDLGRRVGATDLARAHAVALRTLRPGSQIWTDTRDGQCCDRTVVSRAILASGLAIALPVLGLVAALTWSEAQAELAILDAVGIARRRRRRFAAAGMGLLAAFATALALPAGLIPAVRLSRCQ